MKGSTDCRAFTTWELGSSALITPLVCQIELAERQKNKGFMS